MSINVLERYLGKSWHSKDGKHYFFCLFLCSILTVNITDTHICAVKLLFLFHVQSTFPEFSVVFERAYTACYHNIPSRKVLSTFYKWRNWLRGCHLCNICPALTGSEVCSLSTVTWSSRFIQLCVPSFIHLCETELFKVNVMLQAGKTDLRKLKPRVKENRKQEVKINNNSSLNVLSTYLRVSHTILRAFTCIDSFYPPQILIR